MYYNWNEWLKVWLFKLSFTQIKVNPCLYFNEYMICANYAYDRIFWSQNEIHIDKTNSEFKALNFDLTDKG